MLDCAGEAHQVTQQTAPFFGGKELVRERQGPTSVQSRRSSTTPMPDATGTSFFIHTEMVGRGEGMAENAGRSAAMQREIELLVLRLQYLSRNRRETARRQAVGRASLHAMGSISA
jgi:hypothetical protein